MARKKTPAVQIRKGYHPLDGGHLSSMSLRVLEEYRKHFDIEKAFDAVKLNDAEREAMLDTPKFRQQVAESLEWAEKGAGWTKQAAIARQRDVYERLYELAFEEGDVKAYAALANVLKMELDAHGLMRKDDIGSGVVVNITMDIGTSEVKTVSGEVIENGED